MTVQLPLFFVSFAFSQYFIRYTIPTKLRTPIEIFLRIDWLGSLFLLLLVGCTLFGLSFQYNQDYAFSSLPVWGNYLGAVLAVLAFLFVELRISVEPVMAPQLLKMRVPVLVAASSFLVSNAAFAVTYFFPLLFERKKHDLLVIILKGVLTS